MDKEATSRYMKEYAAALGSNPEKAQKIFSTIPEGKTRSIPGTPSLGKGMEGRVFPAVTGVEGDSAVKVFNSKVPRQEVLVPHSQRFAVMAERPDVYPRVHGYGDRHIIMERLFPMGYEQNYREFRTKEDNRESVRSLVESARLAYSPRNPRANRGYLDAVTSAFRGRNVEGKNAHEAHWLSGYLRNPKSQLGDFRVSDVGIAGQNLMRTRGGRLVISDPLISVAPTRAPAEARKTGEQTQHQFVRERYKEQRAQASRLPVAVPRVRRLPRYTAAGIAGLLGALAVPSRAPQGVDAR